MKKLTLLAMALVMALGALGVGYASWTDDITVAGTVTTGSVDFVIEDYSGTEVWKNVATHGFKVVQWPDPDTSGNPFGTDGVLIASSWAQQAVDGNNDPIDDAVSITFDNIYPDVPFKADFVAHYVGSVPVRLIVTDLWFSDTDSAFETPDSDTVSLLPYVDIAYYRGDAVDGPWTEIEELEGEQFEFCEYFKVEITIILPQDNTLMKQYGRIDALIAAVQWDKYIEP